ncbi:hypothetical protein RF11_00689 [Thelohanellus kitauei]|uniref:Uncharacterized protein n=1 Tax=Thelohanellus kitauei TaxID=669202 RepID=A0A0C2N4S2_THEKT|nr:hypothetical protein RF11_00689 [Thelohanellus kitauei]
MGAAEGYSWFKSCNLEGINTNLITNINYPKIINEYLITVKPGCIEVLFFVKVIYEFANKYRALTGISEDNSQSKSFYTLTTKERRLIIFSTILIFTATKSFF